MLGNFERELCGICSTLHTRLSVDLTAKECCATRNILIIGLYWNIALVLGNCD